MAKPYLCSSSDDPSPAKWVIKTSSAWSVHQSVALLSSQRDVVEELPEFLAPKCFGNTHPSDHLSTSTHSPSPDLFVAASIQNMQITVSPKSSLPSMESRSAHEVHTQRQTTPCASLPRTTTRSPRCPLPLG